MNTIIDQLFFIPDPAIPYITAAGRMWGIDVLSFDAVTIFFTVIAYLILAILSITHLKHDKEPALRWILFFGCVALTLSFMLTWAFTRVTGIPSVVDVSIEVVQLIGVCLITVGAVQFFIHESRKEQ